MDKAKVNGDRNQCAGCSEIFNSSAAFDKHRTGEFGRDRRCMTTAEMILKKMAINSAGYWVTALNPMFNGLPNCGACPGDGTICKVDCRVKLESPSC